MNLLKDKSTSLFLSIREEKLSVILFDSNTKERLFSFELALLRIVPNLVEQLSFYLEENNLSFNFIDNLYLEQRESTWNGNRLVSAFVKTVALALPVSIYIREAGDEERSLSLELEKFKKIEWKELKPLYNKCPITNT